MGRGDRVGKRFGILTCILNFISDSDLNNGITFSDLVRYVRREFPIFNEQPKMVTVEEVNNALSYGLKNGVVKKRYGRFSLTDKIKKQLKRESSEKCSVKRKKNSHENNSKQVAVNKTRRQRTSRILQNNSEAKRKKSRTRKPTRRQPKITKDKSTQITNSNSFEPINKTSKRKKEYKKRDCSSSERELVTGSIQNKSREKKRSNVNVNESRSSKSDLPNTSNNDKKSDESKRNDKSKEFKSKCNESEGKNESKNKEKKSFQWLFRR